MDALPPVVREAFAQGANKDFYWKRPIVSQTQIEKTKESEMEPEDQYGAYTTKAAIRVGEILGMSPRRIDHFFTGMVPGAGFDAIAVFGRGGPDREGKTREAEISDNIWWGRAFFRPGGDITTGQRSVNALFGKIREVEKSLDSEVAVNIPGRTFAG